MDRGRGRMAAAGGGRHRELAAARTMALASWPPGPCSRAGSLLVAGRAFATARRHRPVVRVDLRDAPGPPG